MKKSIKHIYVLIILCVFPMLGGSYFSSQPKGLGLRYYSTGVRGMGMGNTGIASLDSLTLSSYAISQWRHINYTQVTISVLYNRINADVGNVNYNTSTGDFAGINLAVPLMRKKWVLGVTLQPYTQVDYKAFDTVESNGVKFTQHNLFTGNISKAQLNLVWSPHSAFGVSVNANYYFGALEDRFEFRFDDNDNASDFLPTSHVVSHRISGPGLGVSMDYQALRNVILAGFMEFQAATNLKISRTSPIENISNTERNFDSFPVHFGLGSSIQISPRWNIAGDYAFQEWSSALKTKKPELEDWTHLGIGFERKLIKKRHSSFFSSMDLRWGFSLTQLGYKFNNESVSQKVFHIGLGIPFSRYRNRIDLAISAGIRGDNDKNLAEEKFVNFDLSLSVGELWFQRIK